MKIPVIWQINFENYSTHKTFEDIFTTTPQISQFTALGRISLTYKEDKHTIADIYSGP